MNDLQNIIDRQLGICEYTRFAIHIDLQIHNSNMWDYFRAVFSRFPVELRQRPETPGGTQRGVILRAAEWSSGG